MCKLCLLLIFTCGQILSKECFNQKSEEEEFCNPGLNWNGDGSKMSYNNVDIEIGDGWQLLSVEERDGKCPGTTEKVLDFTKILKTA